MTATSSAVQLADLALVWGTQAMDPDLIGSADLVMVDSDLASDLGMETAVLLSLFTERRAEDDDVPPSGDENDRRGWWADQFATIEGDRVGSRLWLLDRAKRTDETRRRAEEFIREALDWMIEDRVAGSIDVELDTSDGNLLIGVVVHRPQRDPLSFRFAHAWIPLE